MKRVIYSIFTIAVLAACEPVEDRESLGSTVSIEAVSSGLSVTPYQIDTLKLNPGQTGNYFYVKADDVSVLSKWDFGTGTLVGTEGVVQMLLKGDRVITYQGMCADGSIVTKEFSVHIDTLFNVAPEWSLLTGTNGTKEWKWAPVENGNCWGNTGYHSGFNGNEYGGGNYWWGRTSATIAEDAGNSIENETAYEGYDAGSYMRFDIAGTKMTTFKSDGTEVSSGTFSLDLGKSMYHDNIVGAGRVDPVLGNLKFTGVTILQGVSQNEGQKVVYNFDIYKLTESEMYLGHKTEAGNEGNWGAWSCEEWVWYFVKK